MLQSKPPGSVWTRRRLKAADPNPVLEGDRVVKRPPVHYGLAFLGSSYFMVGYAWAVHRWAGRAFGLLLALGTSAWLKAQMGKKRAS